MTDVRDRLHALDSCALSDAMDALGIAGAVLGLRNLTTGSARFVGTARTVLAGRRTDDGPADHIAASLVDRTKPGDVVVIANEGRVDVSCWGGLLAAAASAHGVAGVVIDGACRDLAESAALDLPVMARAAVPVSARGRIVQHSADEEITVSGVRVASGDWVVADETGIVVIPSADTERVVELAERIVAREAEMLSALRSGRPVNEVMHDSRFPAATP